MIPVRFFSHVYNRGVDKRTIFLNDNHRRRFITAIRLSRLSKSPSIAVLDDWLKRGKVTPEQINNAEKEFGPPILDIAALALMKNHFHLVLGEFEDKKTAISKFMQRLGTAFTMYFNKVEKRKGRLFESKYKSVAVISDDQLLRIIRYVHVNPANSESSGWDEQNLPEYQWSSLSSYLNHPEPWINTQHIMSMFNDKNEFWEYTKSGIRLPKNELLSKKLRLE